MKYFILSMTLLLHGAASQLCTEEEYKKNDDKVSECIANYHNYIKEVLQSKPSGDTKRLVCDYISMAVDNCVKMLDRCEDSVGVLGVKRNNLIEGLINAGGNYGQECQVVVQHRSSRSEHTLNGEIHGKDNSYSDMTYYSDYDEINRKERSTPNDDDCSEAAMQRADNYMENCTSFIGTKTYNMLQATTDPNQASQILCSALADIDTDCVKFATSCLTPQYVSWFIDPIKKYLHDITATKVGEENIPNCNSRDSQQAHSNQAYHTTKEAFDHQEPYDTQESYDTQQAFNRGESHYIYESTPKYNYIGNHRVMSQVRSDDEYNYEDRVVEDRTNNVQKACSERNVYQRMDNCSHITSTNFHKDIQDIYDSARLHKTACQALQVIETECVRNLEGCFSTVDIGEIRDVQMEEWKTFFVKLVNEGNGIRLSLDNCYSHKTEHEAQPLRDLREHSQDRSWELREEAENRRRELIEEAENRKREMIEEDEQRYKHKEDTQMAEYTRRDEYNTHENPSDEHNGHENIRREEYSEQGSTPYRGQSSNDHDNQANNEHCSESNMKIAEDHMDTCTQNVATKAYSQISNSADSVFISNVLCSTRAMIDSQCVQDLKTCFSSQYISWLVEPIQTYLHELAITKVDERALQSCHNFNVEHYEASNENRQKVEENIEEEKYKEENLRYNGYEEEYNEPHNRHAESHENTGTYEPNYPERRNPNEQNRCSEASLYERMGNCSHFAALNVHTEIRHVVESHMLNNIACAALNVIGTDCAKDLYDCYPKIDADEIKILQIEEWKVFIVEMIEGRSGIKLTLDNCYQLTTERTDVDYHKLDYDSNQNLENIREEKETHQYTKEEYKRHEDQDYIATRDPYQEIYHCTESEKKSDQDQADRCIQSIANDAHSTSNSVTDPRIISRNLCLAKARIDTECVQHLTNCFPSEYISWLTEPMKKHLQELAIEKVGADYLEKCYRHETTLMDSYRQETTQRYIPPEIEHTESPQYPYHVQDIGHYVDPSCSETILYERMDNCSGRIARNVWANTKDNPSSSRVSDIICEALTQIGTTCVDVLTNCFAATEVSEMRTVQIKQWIKYFFRISVGTRRGTLSLESCRWNPYVDTNERSSYDYNQVYSQPTARTTYHHYETTPRTTYRHYETTPRTTYRHYETTPRTTYRHYETTPRSSYYHYETTQMTPRYTEYKAVEQQEEYEDCSEIRLKQTLSEMSNCSYSTAINVHWELHTIADHDPNSITNILCNALTIIATDCVNGLQKCYTTDNIREMKNTELKEMQKYLLKLVKIDYDYRSLQSCEVVKGNYDFATEERTEQRYQEYYAQESRDYRIQEDAGYGYRDPNDYGYQDNTGYRNQYDSDHRYQDNTAYTSDSIHGYQDDSAYRYQDNAAYGHTGYTNQENIDYQSVDPPYDHFNEARSGKFCSQTKLQHADDHMANCTRLAAHNAASQLRDIRESNDAFNILCSSLTSIDSDCANLLRECHSDEYVTWMLEPMKGYLIDLGEGKVDSESLQDCKYSNGFSPYRLQ